ncbi:MAG: hypothetical protein NTX50_30545 [Candidatus Sumerlaeota bacterium]|nr:hypothetical protein [Candidatus Sumerlaeota bacterium]
MKPYWKRNRWIYLLTIAAAAWPFVLQRLQRVPPMDSGTVRRFAQYVDDRMTRLHGRPVFADLEALGLKRIKAILAVDGRLARVAMIGRKTPSLSPDFDAVLRAYGETWDEYSRIARSGCAYEPLIEGAKKNEGARQFSILSYYVSNAVSQRFMESVQLRQIGGARFEEDLAKSNWPAAIARLEEIGLVGKAYQNCNTISHLLSISARQGIYIGYGALLNADPPESAERLALASLSRLRESDPALDGEMIGWLEYRNFIETFIAIESPTRPADKTKFPFEISREDAIVMAALNVIQKWAPLSPLIQDARLRAWAGRFQSKYETTSSTCVDFFLKMQLTAHSWTLLPSARLWIWKMAEKQPDFFTRADLPDELVRSSDKWTLALLTERAVDFDWDEIIARERLAATAGRLLQQAFAARLFRREHGQWPAGSAGVLARMRALGNKADANAPWSAKAGGDARAPSEADANAPWSANAGKDAGAPSIQYGWREVNDQLRGELWKQKLAPGSIFSHRDAKHTTITKEGDFLWMDPPAGEGSYQGEPIIAVAIAEALVSSAQLVEGAKTWMYPAGKRNMTRPGATLNEADWVALDPAYARRVTSETEALKWAPPAHDDEQTLSLKNRNTANLRAAGCRARNRQAARAEKSFRFMVAGSGWRGRRRPHHLRSDQRNPQQRRHCHLPRVIPVVC